MNYDELTDGYLERQIDRILETRSKIIERDSVITDGRVVPASGDLPIGVGRRIKASILFLDISDFSSWPSESELEQSNNLRVLTLFFGEMIRITEEYGGVVEKNTGDGIMAYFMDNAGTPPESGCKRAVACALTMFFATDRIINPIIIKSGLNPITFRVGIDYGFVTIAEVGSPRRFKGILAIGTRANISSKMLGHADPGEIIIGEDVKRNLPLLWVINWVEIKTDNSGWIYRSDGSTYSFYRYIGRWVK